MHAILRSRVCPLRTYLWDGGNSLCGRCFTKDSNENITLQILHGELKLFSESNASEKRQSMSL